MVNHFDRNAITEWFWKIIHEADADPDKLKAELEQLSRYDANLFFDTFNAEARQVIHSCLRTDHKPLYPDNIKALGDTVRTIVERKCTDERGQIYPDAITSDWFWNIVERFYKSEEKLGEILQELTSDEIYLFTKELVYAATNFDPELIYSITDVGSEDAIRDCCLWVVSQGERYYYRVWNNLSLFIEAMETDGTKTLEPGTAYGIYLEKGGGSLDLPLC